MAAASLVLAWGCGGESRQSTFDNAGGASGSAGGSGGAAGSDAGSAECVALRADVEDALKLLQNCTANEDCGPVVQALSSHTCTGPNFAAVRSDADTEEYLRALRRVHDSACDTGGGDIETSPPCRDGGPTFPVLCENDECVVVSNFCSTLSGEFSSEETYECREPDAGSDGCRWFVSFDSKSAMVTWDYPDEGSGTPRTRAYRCGDESRIDVLVDDQWARAGTGESKLDLNWFGGRYGQPGVR